MCVCVGEEKLEEEETQRIQDPDQEMESEFFETRQVCVYTLSHAEHMGGLGLHAAHAYQGIVFNALIKSASLHVVHSKRAYLNLCVCVCICVCTCTVVPVPVSR